MTPLSLLQENIVRVDGNGPVIDIARHRGKLLVLTLSITRTIEQASLQVSIFGSQDGVNWASMPLATFPKKSYCGLYSTLLNLSQDQSIRFVRVQWKMTRWSKNSAPPLFSFYVEAEESGTRVLPSVRDTAIVAVA
jgi:hypothetical protein